MLPYYTAVTAVYGGITSAANSILPALGLHTVGDVWSLTRQWLTGVPEWQVGTPVQTIWSTGIDNGFVVAVLALVALSAATVWLCNETAKLARIHRKPPSPQHPL